ncbi:SRPBCC domain-containing protein [Nocardia salmonicida]|uniref:SRPBCC domain-containing protein n=1 Tax=Nocardia salmonicida TaxID=53431 RepID=UPI0007A4A626|nr:SRPBCC domain-containing protein [Nocardia salmonicida]
MTGYIATAEIDISTSSTHVWAVMTDPEQLRELWFGAEVITDWEVGGPIVWRGEFKGQQYEDKGEILEFEPGRLLKMTHFSSLTGQPDVPENYHTLTYELTENGATTHLLLSQDNNADADEVEHARGMWESQVSGIKKAAEQTC